jgi:hypothetical protein
VLSERVWSVRADIVPAAPEEIEMTTTTRRMVATALVAGLATTGMAGLANPAVAQDPGTAPIDLGPGEVLALQPTGCLFEGRPGSAAIALRDPGTPAPSGPLSDSGWFISVHVPPAQSAGPYLLRVDCTGAGGRVDDVPVTIHAEPSVSLATRSVAAGGSLTVSGSHCHGPGTIGVSANPAGRPEFGLGTAATNEDGRWQQTVVIPADGPTGTYLLWTTCWERFRSMELALVKKSTFATFEVTPAAAPTTTTAPPTAKPEPEPKPKPRAARPVAVKADPTFTG